MFQQAIRKQKKLPVGYLNIYHRYLNESKWYLQCRFINTGFKFNRLERCWKKINSEIAKKMSTPYLLKNNTQNLYVFEINLSR